jgi:hypothetical protein
MIMSEVIERPRGILTLRGVIPRPEATPEAAANASPDAGLTAGSVTELRSLPEPSFPSKKAARKAARLAEAKALLRRLADEWPGLFAASEVRPLAIGVHQAILELLPEIDPKLLGAALRLHTRRAGYVAAILSAGYPRFDLQGEPAGAVTAEQVQGLMAERARLAEKSAGRRAEEQRQARRQRVA